VAKINTIYILDIDFVIANDSSIPITQLHTINAMSFYNDHCYYLPAMLCWFFSSAALSSYNKIVFGREKIGFPCPLLMTSFHFLVQWIYSYSATSSCPMRFGQTVSRLEWSAYLATAFPCALVTTFDVGLSNLALVRISISFYTMVKASAPIFTLLSAYLFGIEKITCSLLTIVLIIAIGELFTVEGEVEFDLIGFILCLSASVLSGIRWTTVQFTLQKLDPPLKTAVETMRLISPFMFIMMLLMSFSTEKPWVQLGPGSEKNYFVNAHEAFKILGMAVGGASLAIFMIMSELWLIMEGSAIILMVGGVIKEIFTILVGVILFKDSLDLMNIVGCLIIFSGALLFKLSHLRQKREAAQSKEPRFSVQYRPTISKENDEVQSKALLMNDNSLKDFNDEIIEKTELENMDSENMWGAIEMLREKVEEENPEHLCLQDNTNQEEMLERDMSIGTLT